MGYPMAINLRSKLDAQHTLLICDVDKDAIARFQKETEGQGPVRLVETGSEAAKESVSYHPPFNLDEKERVVWINDMGSLEHSHHDAAKLPSRTSRIS